MVGPVKEGDLLYAAVHEKVIGCATTHHEPGDEAVLLGKVVEECEYSSPAPEVRFVHAFVSLNNSIVGGKEKRVLGSICARLQRELGPLLRDVAENAQTAAAMLQEWQEELHKCQEALVQRQQITWCRAHRLSVGEDYILRSVASRRFLQLPDERHHVVFATGGCLRKSELRLEAVPGSAEAPGAAVAMARVRLCHQDKRAARYLALNEKGFAVLVDGQARGDIFAVKRHAVHDGKHLFIL